MMTCFAACVGLLPAALSRGVGAQVQRPLAIVVVGGNLLAPILILIVLPVLIDACKTPRAQNRSTRNAGEAAHTPEGASEVAELARPTRAKRGRLRVRCASPLLGAPQRDRAPGGRRTRPRLQLHINDKASAEALVGEFHKIADRT